MMGDDINDSLDEDARESQCESLGKSDYMTPMGPEEVIVNSKDMITPKKPKLKNILELVS